MAIILVCVNFLESVLLVAPVGLQLTATYQSGHQISQFIPWHFIADVIINEAITQACRRNFVVHLCCLKPILKLSEVGYCN
jgi:uncharacterized membrane protein YwaF